MKEHRMGIQRHMEAVQRRGSWGRRTLDVGQAKDIGHR